MAHQTLRDFFSQLIVHLCLRFCFRLVFLLVCLVFFLFTLVSILERNLFYAHFTAMQEFSRCSPSPTPLRVLEVQPAEGHCQCNPHKEDCKASSLCTMQNSSLAPPTAKNLLKTTVLTLWDVACATRNCSGKTILSQTRNSMPPHFWLATKNLIMVPWYYSVPVSASTRTSKLQGKHQDTPPEISMKCFQLLFYPYSWNTKCTHRAEQHQLTADKQ